MTREGALSGKKKGERSGAKRTVRALQTTLPRKGAFEA